MFPLVAASTFLGLGTTLALLLSHARLRFACQSHSYGTLLPDAHLDSANSQHPATVGGSPAPVGNHGHRHGDGDGKWRWSAFYAISQSTRTLPVATRPLVSAPAGGIVPGGIGSSSGGSDPLHHPPPCGIRCASISVHVFCGRSHCAVSSLPRHVATAVSVRGIRQQFCGRRWPHQWHQQCWRSQHGIWKRTIGLAATISDLPLLVRSIAIVGCAAGHRISVAPHLFAVWAEQ